MVSYEKVKSGKRRIKTYRELIEATEKITANLRFRSYDVYQLCEASFDSRGELEILQDVLKRNGGERVRRLFAALTKTHIINL